MLARAVDVAEVLLLALVDLPEHLLEEDLGEAEHRVERRAQLVRHARQELRLVLLATSSSALRFSSSPKSRALTEASVDWLAKVSISSTVSAEKPPVRFRRTMSAPTICCSRSIGTASTDRQPTS